MNPKKVVLQMYGKEAAACKIVSDGTAWHRRGSYIRILLVKRFDKLSDFHY
jgi:hypothetical protein